VLNDCVVFTNKAAR